MSIISQGGNVTFPVGEDKSAGSDKFSENVNLEQFLQLKIRVREKERV